MPYFLNTIEAGQTIEVHKSFTKFTGKIERSGKSKTTPEQIEKINEINAQNKLTRIINANFAFGDYHIIATYKKDLRADPEQAKKEIKKFLRQLKAEYKKVGSELKYVQVTEYKNKVIHHHLIINNVKGQNITTIVRKLWTRGTTHFTPLDNTGQYKTLAEYLIKETAKTYKEKNGGQMQRYSCSRNLKKPVTKTKIVKSNRWAADPKPIKGYYIDMDTLHNGVNPFTGREYQRYTMIKIPPIQKRRGINDRA